MIGFDGADWQLIERLLDKGKLPNLARLKQAGCYGALDSPADHYAGGVWPDFYTAKPVSHHGIYHNKLWRQQAMRCEVPTDEWLTSRPFYEDLSEQGYRVCVLDMPMVLGQPRQLNGINLAGWGTHDLIARGATPSDLWQQLVSRFGKPSMPVEYYGQQSCDSLLLLREQLLQSTRQMASIAVDLLSSEPWDFSCLVLGAAHRGGHYLWDDSQLSKEPDNGDLQGINKIQTALEDILIACDVALGNVLSAIPDESLKIVFAVHGMKQNHGWGDVGNDIIEAIARSSQQQKIKRGLLYQVRRRVPFNIVRPILTRMPQSVSEALVRLWSANMYDWQKTPYFPLPMDQAGYIRINLKGREKRGIVEPGENYQQLCDELEKNLYSLKDADSGQSIVAEVVRAWQNAPEDTEGRDVLPDLVVVWDEVTTLQCQRVISDRLTQLAIDVPMVNISGRSGNHTGPGWFVAQGGEIKQQGLQQGHSIRDLAPAIFEVMGANAPSHFESSSLFSQWLCSAKT